MPDWLAAPDYATARWVVQHLVALVYVIAFTVALAQFRPLIGERGLTPIPRFLARTTFRRHPSLFHLRYSDTVFRVVAALGLVLAVAALAGATDVLPLGAGIALWAVLWVLYLSIVNVGQVWYGFGWESLLLEAGFLVDVPRPRGRRPARADPVAARLAAVPRRVRRGPDQAARRPLLARPHLPRVPPRDPAAAGPDELVLPPPAAPAAPRGGARQPRHPARRPVPAVPPPAGRRRSPPSS